MHDKVHIILIILVIGYPLLFFGSYVAEKAMAKRYNQHSARLVRRSILILGTGILTIDLLREFDLKLTALLGSAGIAGVAIGFALKTSVSNIISGIFVSLEVPFKVGDFIEIEQHKGTIVSFDLLSVKICSPDNNFIRIPNEQVLKSSVINHSKYPEKRLSLDLQFPYSWGHDQVYSVINTVVDNNVHCLPDPPHQIKFTEFADSAISCELCVWIQSREYSAAKKSIAMELHKAFTEAGIDMPYPHIALANATGNEPLKAEVVSG
jgi:small-conductance mechanosensitive channel